MKLWLVRHAAPQVEPGLCYGRLDVSVDPSDTARVAKALAEALPPSITLRSSPASRCLQLAQALAQLRTDLRPEIEPRLQEMDFGAWEGRTWTAVGAAALQAWTDDFAGFRPGGGESVTQVLGRVGQVFDECARAGGSHAWITHAGVVRAARLIAGGQRAVSDASDWPAQAVPFSDWGVLET